METSIRKRFTANHRWAEACGFGSDNLLATCLQRVAALGRREPHGYQTHLSTLRGQAQAHARIPGPHEVARRPRGAERAPRQGTQASRNLSGARPTAAYAFTRAQRLQSEAEFAAVAQAGRDAIRLSQRWFLLMAKPVALTEQKNGVATVQRVRFGLTVGKRLARRSVDRVLIKRILREAARHSTPRLVELAPSGFDVVLRLKAPLPARATTARRQLKRALRDDADALLRRFSERLAAAKPQ
jgi:ribonuclease P protein component